MEFHLLNIVHGVTVAIQPLQTQKQSLGGCSTNTNYECVCVVLCVCVCVGGGDGVDGSTKRLGVGQQNLKTLASKDKY